MSVALRVLLIVGSIVSVMYIIIKIRNAKIQIEYSIFWIFFSVILLLMSLFPKIPIMVSHLIGVQSPINLVFLVIIFLLIMRLFSLTVKISELENKLSRIAQRMALNEAEQKEAK